MFKGFLVGATLVGLAATSAMAREGEPLVVKSSGTGFTPVEWARGELCEVYADHVVIKRRLGRFMTEERRDLTVGAEIAQTIEKAAAEEVKEKENSLCDGPATTTLAYRLLADGSKETLVLFSTGGCGTPRKERSGPAGSALRDLVDAYCPKTYDIGR